MMRGLMLVVGLLAAAPAMAADQFDLVCKGQYRDRPSGKWTPIETHYRIDLAAKAWCQGNCSAIRKIEAVEEGKIVLMPYARDQRAGSLSFYEVDRVTGAYESYTNEAGIYFDEKGSCSSAPFSGLPAAKF